MISGVFLFNTLLVPRKFSLNSQKLKVTKIQSIISFQNFLWYRLHKGFDPIFCGILIIRPVQIYFSRQKCYTFEPGVRVYATFEPWICPQRCRCSVGLAKTHLSVENRFRPHSWTLPRTQWIQIISEVVFLFLANCFFTRYFISCNTCYLFKNEIGTLFP